MGFIDKITGADSGQDSYKVAPIPERLKRNERVAIVTADKTEDLEFFYPYYRLTEAGYDVDVITPEGGDFDAKHGLGLKQTLAIDSVNPMNYVLLYIPGGKAPEELRDNDSVLNFVKQFAQTGKPIASICHGAQVLISAGLANGRQLAAWPEMRDEVQEAGATFVDEALVIDGQFITARKPGDLHRHLSGVLDVLENGVSSQGRAQRKSTAA